MNIKFNLRNAKAQGETSIKMLISHNGKRGKFSTGIKIEPDLWQNGSPKKPKDLTVDQQKFVNKTVRISRELAEWEREVLQIAGQKDLENETYEAADIVKVLKDKYRPAPEPTEPEARKLVEYYSYFIIQAQQGKRLTPEKQTKYTNGTIRSHITTRNQLDAYQVNRGIILDFNDINEAIYKDFISYLQDKNYKHNSIGKHIKNLKVIMRLARNEGLHNSVETEKAYFKTQRTAVDTVYLEDIEIKAMQGIDLSGHPEHDKARDLFLIGCYTALRVSDIMQIRPVNIKKTTSYQYIDIHAKKTGQRLMIPIKPELSYILNKYDNEVPYMADQRINDLIKDVAEWCGIDEPVQLQSITGGKTKTETKQKFELITNHTGRRSAATNMYLAGVPTLDIMKITGHTREENFLKYIRVTQQQTADNLAKHSFFSGQ